MPAKGHWAKGVSGAEMWFTLAPSVSLARAASGQLVMTPCWIFPCASPDPVSMLHPSVGPGWLACVDRISHPGFPSRKPWQGFKHSNVYVSAPSLPVGLSPFTKGHGSHSISLCWVRARSSLLFLRVGLLMPLHCSVSRMLCYSLWVSLSPTHTFENGASLTLFLVSSLRVSAGTRTDLEYFSN